MNDPVELIEESAEERPVAVIRYRRAIIVSVIFHIALLIVLLFWYLPAEPDNPGPDPMTASQSSSTSPPEPSSLPKPIENPNVPPDQIQASIESQVDKYEKMSDERKLSELEKNLKRLNAIASEESVQEVTSTIANSLGLDETYTPKQEPAEGSFDTNTAQLSDVRRSRDDDGNWQYESVLIDSEGRSLVIPLNVSEGETAYSTFEQLRKYPMAAGIYRGVVMPMMQRMLEAGDLLEKAAVEAERINAEQPTPSDAGSLDPPRATSD